MQQIDISPPSNVYATFGRLNYTPWHAIAEFVDNATQSFFRGRADLGPAALPELRVTIKYKQGQLLSVADNALGMDVDELARALRLSTPPPDTSGRSEFGMGLKTAACWFGERWEISTTKLGERWRYRVVFDLKAVATSDLATLDVEREPAPEAEHGTRLQITHLSRPIAGRQSEKTKKLLASIYRRDLQSGRVKISWNDSWLHFEDPELMDWEVDEAQVPCKVRVDLAVTDPSTGTEHQVRGWVGSLLKMSQQEAGFALLRRGRMVVGGPGMNWRPKEVVGDLGSHSGKRLVGELEMDSFPVNFTKDGFAWDSGLDDAFLEAIASAAEPVRRFAANARLSKRRIEPQDFTRAVDEIQRGVDSEQYKSAVSGERTWSHHEVNPMEVGDARPAVRRDVPQELKVPLADQLIRARLSLTDGGPQESWLSIGTGDDSVLIVSLNTGNRFVAQHMENESERTLIAKFALAVAAAEAQGTAVFGDCVPPDELREFLNLALDHSVLDD